MTATRISGRAGTLAAAFVLGAGLWLLAASFLWRTSVPHDLSPPRLNDADYFSAAEIHRAAHFSDVLNWLLLGATAVQLIALGLVAWYGPRLASVFAVGRIGRGVLVGCLAVTAAVLVSLPFELVATWWERRYGLVFLGYGEVLLATPPSLGIEVALVSILIVLLMALATWLPRTWWVAAAAALTAIGVPWRSSSRCSRSARIRSATPRSAPRSRRWQSARASPGRRSTSRR